MPVEEHKVDQISASLREDESFTAQGRFPMVAAMSITYRRSALPFRERSRIGGRAARR